MSKSLPKATRHSVHLKFWILFAVGLVILFLAVVISQSNPLPPPTAQRLESAKTDSADPSSSHENRDLVARINITPEPPSPYAPPDRNRCNPWEDVTCEDDYADCINGGGIWPWGAFACQLGPSCPISMYWNGLHCQLLPQYVLPTPAHTCASNGGQWTGTTCVYRPRVTGVSANPIPEHPYLKEGDRVTIRVGFSEDVTLDSTDGLPTLSLSITDSEATYSSQPEDDQSYLDFEYTVGAGHNTPQRDIDDASSFLDAVSFKLNGAVISDDSDNALATTDGEVSFSSLTSANKLAASELTVDTKPPRIIIYLDPDDPDRLFWRFLVLFLVIDLHKSGEKSKALIPPATNCDATAALTAFEREYQSGVVLDSEAHNNHKVCIEIVDLAGNVSYAESSVVTGIDRTPPTINVSEVTNNQVSATVTDARDSNPTFEYQILASGNCNASTGGIFTSYTSGTQLSLPVSQFACFKATDAASNTAYAASNSGSSDSTPPTITVTPASDDSSPKREITVSATASDSGSGIKSGSLVYKLIDSGDSCDSTEMNSGTSPGSSVTLNSESDNNKKVCFQVEDQATNKGYGVSGTITNIDRTAPVIRVGSVINNQVSASVTETNLAAFGVQKLTSGSCHSTTTGSFTDYSSGDRLTLAVAETACFKATDTAGNTSYRASSSGSDITAPTITVSPATDDSTAKTEITVSASSDDPDVNTSTWAHKVIEGTDTCDSTEMTSGNSVTLNSESDNGKKVCFTVRDNANNPGYATSGVITGIDTTAPTITVTPSSDVFVFSTLNGVSISVSSPDNLGVNPAWRYRVLYASFTCDESEMSSPQTVTEHSYGGFTVWVSTLFWHPPGNSFQVCFHVADLAGNEAYQASGTVTVLPLTIIVSPSADHSTPKTEKEVWALSDDTDVDASTWAHKVIAGTDTCNSTEMTSGTTSGGNFILLNSEAHNNHKVCFTVRGLAGNYAYQASGIITGIDRTAPEINVSSVVNNQVSASVTETNLAAFGVQKLTSGSCHSTTTGSFTDYSSGDRLTLAVAETACFKATDTAGNTSYRASSSGSDITAPTITVSPATDDSTAKTEITVSASSDDPDVNTSTWAHKVIEGTDTCDSTEMTSGNSVTLNSESDNGKKVCFTVRDNANNPGYATSGVITGIDRTAPTITSIFGDKIDQAHAQGAIIEIAVLLSEALTDLTEPSQLTLSLNSGGTAIYRGSSSPDLSPGRNRQLSFNYTVAAGDNTDDLDVTAFNLNGDTVTDRAGNSLDTTLPAGSNLADSSEAVIDTTDPVITISSLVNNQVSASVTETNLAAFEVQKITSGSCSSSTTGSFTDYNSGETVTLVEGTTACFKATDTAGNTSYRASTSGRDITAPTITVTPSTDDSSPKREITVLASSTASDLGSNPTWTHKLIAAADTCDQTEMNSGTSSGSSVTLNSESDNNKKVCFRVSDTSSNPGFGLSGLITGIDRTAPTITSIFGDKIDQAHAQGAIIEIAVLLSEALTDLTEPSQLTLSLNSGGTAIYRGSSSPDLSPGRNRQLSFNYTVAAGDNTDDLDVTAFNLNGDTVTDRAGNSLDTTLPAGSNLADSSEAVIDTTDPVITISSLVNNQVSASVTETNLAAFEVQKITSGSCSSSTTGSFTDYNSGETVTLVEGTTACFKATDTAGNTSYRASTSGRDITAPTITVTPSTDDSSPKREITVLASSTASDLGSNPTWTHKLIAAADTCDQTEMNSGTSSGSSVTLNSESDNNKKVCFRVSDTSSNPGFGLSGLITGIDRTAPTITSIFGDKIDQAHAQGAIIEIAVLLSEALTDLTEPSQLTLSLNSGGTAIYRGSSSPDLSPGRNRQLSFNYTVAAGDNTDDLDVTAFNLNGDTVTDRAGNSLDTTLPAGSNLADSSEAVIDTTDPVITISSLVNNQVSASVTETNLAAFEVQKITSGSCSSSTTGSFTDYNSGETVTLVEGTTACFKATDTAGNTSYRASTSGRDITAPTITVTPSTDDSSPKREITVLASSTASDLGSNPTWTHKLIAAADTCDQTEMNSGTSSGSSVTLNSESDNNKKVCFRVSDTSSNPGFGLSGLITGIDRTAPTITSIFGDKIDQAHAQGAIIEIAVLLSEALTDLTEPSQLTLSLNSGGTAIYRGSSSPDLSPGRNRQLSFNYTVAAGDNTDDLDVTAFNLNGDTVTDRAGNSLDTTLPAGSNLADSSEAVIDTTDPVITISSLVNNQVSASVTETNLAAFEVQKITSGSCSSSTTGSFTDYNSGETVTLVEGTTACFKATDTAGNTSYRASTSGRDITAPTITVTPSTDDSSPKREITVLASSTASDLGSNPTWTHKLIAAADTCDQTEMNSGTSSGSSVTLNSESDNNKKVCFRVSDTSSNPGFGLSGLITGIDRTAPTITSIFGDKIDQAHAQGAIIEIAVLLSEALTDLTEPSQLTLSLNSGGTAIYRGSSSPDLSPGRNRQLSFNYTVAAGDNTDDLDVTAFNLNGDTVTDRAGNSLDTTLPAGSNLADSSEAVIDTTDPVITISSLVNNQVSASVTETNLAAFEVQKITSGSCSSSTTGSFTDYNSGETVTLVEGTTACFKATDTAGNTSYRASTSGRDITAPTITVTPSTDDSSPKREITVLASSTASDLGSNPTWTHKLIAAADTCDQTEMNSGTSSGSSVTLNSESDNNKKVCFRVSDTSSNPGFGLSGLITGIDRTAPTITSIFGDKIDQAHAQGAIIEIAVLLSEALTDLTEPSQLTLSLNSGGTAIYRGSSSPDLSPGRNRQLSFNYTVAAGDNTDDLDVTAFNLNGDTVTDRAGNSLDTTLPAGSNLADSSEAVIDTTDPVITISSLVNNQVSASVTETNLAAFEVQKITSGSCSSSTTGSFTDYNSGETVTLVEGTTACFKATDTAGNTSYRASTSGRDITAPTITVTPSTDDSSPKREITVLASSTASDLGSNPTWTHKLIAAADTCDQTEMNSGTSSGSSVTLNSESDNNKKVCFRVSDTSSNPGFGLSGLITGIDRTAPTITSIFGDKIDQAHAQGAIIEIAVLLSEALTDLTEPSQLTLSLNSGGTAIYRGSSSPDLSPGRNRQLSFNYTVAAGDNTDDLDVTAFNLNGDTVTDRAGNSLDTTLPAGSNLADSSEAVIDTTDPVITISSLVNNQVSASVTETNLAAFEVQKITSGSCSSSTTGSFTDYNSGETVTLVEGTTACFKATDTAGNTSYRASTSGRDITAPTITVTPSTDDSSPKREITVLASSTASDLGSNPTWTHKLIAAADTCDQTEMNSGTSSGSSVTLNSESDNNKKVCFRVSDTSSNPGFGLSGLITGIDRTAPTITSIFGDKIDQAHAQGAIIEIAVLLSEALTDLTEPSQLTLSLNSGGTAIYRGSSSPDLSPGRNRQLSFNYTVAAGDNTDDLDVTAFNLNGDTVTDRAGNSLDTTLPAGSNLADSSEAVIDTTDPVITISSLVNNQVSASVTETNLAAFEVQKITSGSCSSSTTGSFTDYNSGETVTLVEGTTACFKATDTAGNTSYRASTSGRDITAPTITVTPSTDDSSPKREITVLASSTASDLGSNPTWTHKLIAAADTCDQTEMNSGTSSGSSVTLNSESDNNKKVCFRVSDTSSNPGFGLSGLITGIDRTAPTITSIFGDKIDQAHAQGAIIEIAVLLSEALTDLTEPSQLTLSLNSGGTAIYRGSSSPDLSPGRNRQLSFNYTVAAGDNTDDLDVTAFNLNGDTVTDRAGNSLDTTLPAGSNLADSSEAVIDTTDPVITISSLVNNQVSASVTETNLAAFEVQKITSGSCSSSTTGSFTDYNSGETVTLVEGTTACFKATDTAGNTSYRASTSGRDITAPTITVTPSTDDSSPKREITVLASSTASDLGSNPTWTHKLIAAADTCDQTEMNSGTSSGSSVTLNSESDNNKKVCFRVSDTSSNPGFGLSGLITGIDRTAPTITSIFGDKIDQAHAQGAIIEIAVLLSEALTDLTEPSQLTLSLNSGGTAIYRGSSSPDLSPGRNRQLSFNYTVAAGDNTDDLDVTAFNLNGDTVTDRAGNSLDTTLPAGSNLADSSEAVIDTTDPVITISSLVNNQVSASVTETNLAAFEVQKITSGSCSSSTTGSFTDYNSGETVTLVEGTTACFKATDTAGNTSYRASTSGRDITAPTITVTPSTDDSSPKREITVLASSTASDLGSNPTWTHKLIAAADTCDQTEMNSGTSSGSSVTLNSESDNNKKVCFRVSDTSSNPGYGVSGIISGIDITKPVINVSTVTNNQLSATVSDNLDNNPSFTYQLLSSGNCDNTTGGSFATYNPGSQLTLSSGQTACFKALDAAGNVTYAASSSGTDITAHIGTSGGSSRGLSDVSSNLKNISTLIGVSLLGAIFIFLFFIRRKESHHPST